MAEKQRFKVVETADVTEEYANQFISGGYDGSAVHITLGTTRFTPERLGDALKEGVLPNVHVTHRIALSTNAALDLVQQIKGMLDQLGIRRGAPRVAQDNPAPPPAAN